MYFCIYGLEDMSLTCSVRSSDDIKPLQCRLERECDRTVGRRIGKKTKSPTGRVEWTVYLPILVTVGDKCGKCAILYIQ